MHENQRQKDFFWGVLFGGAVAALTSALFTTKKGKQIRDQISDVCEEVSESVKDVLSDTKDKVVEAAEHVDKKITDSKNTLEEEAEHVGKKVAHEAKHD